MDRAILEKKPSTRLSLEPCFGVDTKVKRPSELLGEPRLGFFGGVGQDNGKQRRRPPPSSRRLGTSSTQTSRLSGHCRAIASLKRSSGEIM
jgi:hypothetical protein